MSDRLNRIRETMERLHGTRNHPKRDALWYVAATFGDPSGEVATLYRELVKLVVE
ncbi:MAG TPA: hypothetical protein VFQ42_22500 [Mycobacterium sp.]|nr:hypothetical protein [Mycobacterium sp.]